MKTDCNYEPPNVPCKNLQGKLLPKLLAFSTSTFPTVQTHVKLSNLRDLRPATLKQKIPRPPNAFMLFANDFRRKLAGEFPKESNKDISVRLGCMWKNMEKDTKERYFQIAKEVDAAHKRKYPDYVYNPKEARLRKALREKSRGERQGGPASSGQRGGAPASWSKPRQNMNPRQPICVQMVGDQQQLSHRQLHQQQFRQLQQQPVSLLRGNKQTDTAATMMLQNYNDYLDFPYHHVAQAADYTLLPEHHQSDSWYSSTFLQQGPEHNATSTSYAMRSEAGKVAESNEWSSHFNTENNAAFIHSNSENTAEKDGTSRSEQYIDSGREQATVNGGPHHHPQHSQQQCMSVQSSAEQDNNAPVPVSDIETENGVLLEPNLMETKTLLTLSQPSHGKLQSAAEVKSNGGNTSKDGLRLPGFHQAFGSTEIGRFSQHEEFFEAQPLPQPQDTKAMKLELSTPPRRDKGPDSEGQNSGSLFDTPGKEVGAKWDANSPGSWSFLFHSPTNMFDGAGSTFGSPTLLHSAFPFIDYSYLPTDLVIRNDPMPEEILPDVLTNTITEVNIKRENANDLSSVSSSCFGDESSGTSPYKMNGTFSDTQPESILGLNTSEDFANHDFRMNCPNQQPVIVSENDKICVMMESANNKSDPFIKEFTYL